MTHKLVFPEVTYTDRFYMYSTTYPEIVFKGKITLDGFVINNDCWAPGYFAGSEGADIKIDNREYIIKSVDLERKIIKYGLSSRK